MTKRNWIFTIQIQTKLNISSWWNLHKIYPLVVIKPTEIQYLEFSEFWAQIVPFLRTHGYVMGYPFKDNAVIFWQFSTYVSVIIHGFPKIVIGLGTVGVTAPLSSTIGTQKNCRGLKCQTEGLRCVTNMQHQINSGLNELPQHDCHRKT